MQHPEERLERKKKKITEGSSASLLHNLEFNPPDCINKPLVFNLKKAREDQIIERIIENLPKDNDEYYIEHRKDSNMFMIKQDPKQQEKENLFKAILFKTRSCQRYEKRQERQRINSSQRKNC